MKIKNTKNLSISILALQFLVCGSIFISQMYRLYNFYHEDVVTIIALRWNYIAQVIGMLLFILLFIKRPRLVAPKMFYASLIAISTLLIPFLLSSDKGIIVTAFGLLYNVYIGFSSGYTISMLTAYISRQGLGLAFGVAYAIGSIGTYLLSLLGESKILMSKQIAYLYIILNIISIIIIYISKGLPLPEEDSYIKEKKQIKEHIYSNKSQYILLFTLLILINAISSLGNNFQFSVIVNADINLPLSRAFYAIGLILAGLISLRSRKYIAITTFACLLYPVIAVIVSGNSSLATTMLTLSYFFLGFVSVYRSLTTMDIASDNRFMLAFACTGLMVSRLAEATSTIFSNLVVTNKLLAAIIFVVLFALLIFAFLELFQKNYTTISVAHEITEEQRLLEFSQEYNLSLREKEVLQLIIKGSSNKEISELLFVTESTIKFHVKNILKKTSCDNRTSLIKLYTLNR